MKKNRYLDDRCSLVGSKEDIAKHLNLGPAQNLIQSFFNYKIDKCSYCNGVKGLNGIRQFERAQSKVCQKITFQERKEKLAKEIEEVETPRRLDLRKQALKGELLHTAMRVHQSVATCVVSPPLGMELLDHRCEGRHARTRADEQDTLGVAHPVAQREAAGDAAAVGAGDGGGGAASRVQGCE